MRRADALDQIERAMGTIGRVASSVQASRRRAELAGADVSAPGMGILGVLARGGPQRVSAIARRSGMIPTLASRELRALEQAGYVARTTDEEDRRAVVVTITQDGGAAYAKLRAASVEVAGNALAAWSAGDLSNLAELLTRMADDFVAVRP